MNRPVAPFALLLAALASCETLSPSRSPDHGGPHAHVAKADIDRPALQTRLLDLAESAIGDIDYATRKVLASSPSPHVARETLTIRVNVASIMTALATSGEPESGLVDMLIYATLRRDATRNWLASRPPEAPEQALGSACDRVAREARELAESVLSADQLARVQELIATWHVDHPNATYVGLVRLDDLVELRSDPFRSETVASITPSLLDPVADAERSIERTRIFGERLSFVMQRMPYFVRWQAEELLFSLLEREELAALGRSADHAREALEHVATSIDSARTEIQSLRSAFNEVGGPEVAELRGFAGDIRTTVSDIRGLLPDARATMSELRTAVEGAERVTASLDALTRGADGTPIDLTAISAASERFATASADLREAIAQANALLSSEEAARRLEDIAKTGRSSIDHLIWRIGQLIIIVGSLGLVLRIVWVLTRPRVVVQPSRR